MVKVWVWAVELAVVKSASSASSSSNLSSFDTLYPLQEHSYGSSL